MTQLQRLVRVLSQPYDSYYRRKMVEYFSVASACGIRAITLILTLLPSLLYSHRCNIGTILVIKHKKVKTYTGKKLRSRYILEVKLSLVKKSF